MTPLEVEITRYKPAFRREVAELQKHLWRRDFGKNLEYLEWKHERNPFSEQPFIYLAILDDQVIGMRGLLGGEWECGDQSFRILSMVDSVIVPKYRNQGVYESLTSSAFRDLSQRGHEFVFNLSPAPSTYLNALMSGWRSVGPLQVMTWERHRSGGGGATPAANRMRRYTAKVQPLATAAVRRARRLAAKLVPSEPGDQLSKFATLDQSAAEESAMEVEVSKKPRPTEMSALVDQIPSDGRIRHLRDERYFRWRFQNPFAEYRFLFSLDAHGRTDGYLVLQAGTGPEGGSVSMVDWKGTSAQAREALLNAAILRGDFNKLSIWSSTLDENQRRILRDHGFEVKETSGSIAQSRPSLLVKRIVAGQTDEEWQLGTRDLLTLESWDLRQIYSDAY